MKLFSFLKFIFFFILFSISISFFAQEEEIIEEEIIESVVKVRQKISISELAKIINSGDKEITISDYEIISSEDDKDYLINKVFFSLHKIEITNSSTEKIYIYNCKFNLNDNSPLVIAKFKLSKLNIVGCEFISPIAFEDFSQYGKYAFLIENCDFNNELRFTSDSLSNGYFIFKNNKFHTNLILESPLENLEFTNNEFIADNSSLQSLDKEKTYYQLVMEGNKYGKVSLINNDFKNNKIVNIYSINFQSAEFKELLMDSNHLQTLNLSSAAIEKAFLVDSLFVENYIGILNFDFPEKNTNASWHNLGGEKFAIFVEEISGFVVPYQAKTDEQLAENLKYNDLMSAYNKFNTLYHDRGDINSANASYVEIKDIETRKQAFVQKINPSINNLINYKLNVFLRFFSDYATNPGKSLEQSICIILIFTLLYMLSFSKWDKLNCRFHYIQFKLFSNYITYHKSIEEVYSLYFKMKKTDEDSRKIVQKKDRISVKEMPRLLKLTGRLLITMGRVSGKILPKLIGIFNFQPKEWKSLNKIEKIWSGTMIAIISVIYLFSVLIVKLFNSLILSLNSFVVIGFGSLPEEDNSIAMYLSIIEGIIGWFLLTIFTITLFSQVLQNA